jgi:hypothetical protein
MLSIYLCFFIYNISYGYILNKKKLFNKNDYIFLNNNINNGYDMRYNNESSVDNNVINTYIKNLYKKKLLDNLVNNNNSIYTKINYIEEYNIIFGDSKYSYNLFNKNNNLFNNDFNNELFNNDDLFN